ncbi:MAG: T9SS type A sorting domain-containing protein [Bacteroidetes bacterium]|nr:T9SS type A sorting domain-containing protein [Bacteroidota bacterium]
MVLTNGSLTNLNVALVPVGAACTDVYETNNSSSTAKAIPVSIDIFALIGVSGDLDWLTFATVSPNTKLKVTLQNLPADYDLRLYSSSNALLAKSQNNGTANETIIRNATTAATYKVRVNGYNGAFNNTVCYKLRVDVSSTNFVKSMPLNEAFNKYSDEGDLQVFPNPSENDVALLFTSEMQTTGTIRVFDMLGKPVSQSNIDISEGENLTMLSLQNLTAGIYMIEVNDGAVVYKTRIIKN